MKPLTIKIWLVEDPDPITYTDVITYETIGNFFIVQTKNFTEGLLFSTVGQFKVTSDNDPAPKITPHKIVDKMKPSLSPKMQDSIEGIVKRKTRLVRIRFTQEMIIDMLKHTFNNSVFPDDLIITNSNVDVHDQAIQFVMDSKEFEEYDLHEGGEIRVSGIERLLNLVKYLNKKKVNKENES